MTDRYAGFAVELLRSCYYSTWTLPGAEGRLIQGRYCFAAPGTPLYQGDIYVCSRNWVTAELDFSPSPYGEQFPPGVNGKRPYFKGRCSDPWAVGIGAEVESGTMPTMGGGEVESGTLTLTHLIGGGEVESGYLQPLNRTAGGGEVESGRLLLHHRIGGGEVEGGTLTRSTRIGGGEVEGGTLIPRATTIGGGEVEGGALVGAEMGGGEVEGGDSGVVSGGGGEVEGAVPDPIQVRGGEVEGGMLRLVNAQPAGEVESGRLIYTVQTGGGEVEYGTLDRIPSTTLAGGEVEGYSDFFETLSPDLWLDALQLQLSSGAAVSLWPDKSGNGNDASQAFGPDKPIFDPSGGGAAAAVRFDSTSHLVLNSPVAGGLNLTSFAVVRLSGLQGALGDGGVLCSRSVLDTSYPVTIWSSVSQAAGYGVNSSVTATAWAWSSSRTDMLVAKRNGSRVDIDAYGAGHSHNFGTVFTGAFAVDNVGGGTGFGKFEGWIYELIVFNRTLTAVEESLILQYLALKWGVSY